MSDELVDGPPVGLHVAAAAVDTRRVVVEILKFLILLNVLFLLLIDYLSRYVPTEEMEHYKIIR